MNIKHHILYGIMLLILSVIIGYLLRQPSNVVEVEKITTDTITITKYDTITYTNVIERDRFIVDTVYVPSDGKDPVVIPISEYRFFEEHKYDITAKGYNVSLPNVTVFPKTEYKTITYTIEKTVIPQKWDLYAGINLSAYNKEVIPSITLTAKTPKRWLISGNIGVYNSKPVYGVGIQYKLNK